MQLVHDLIEPDHIEELDELLRAADGDEAAVRALFRRHSGRIYRTAARVLGSHYSDLEDVVQQVFLAALKGAHGFHGRSSVGTWLVGIAVRRALDEGRSRTRRNRWSRVSDVVGLGRGASRPDEHTAHRNQAEAALALLNPDQRTVFVLHEVEGHTLKEIGEMTGTGISTLHARLKAARRRLDAEFSQGGGHE